MDGNALSAARRRVLLLVWLLALGWCLAIWQLLLQPAAAAEQRPQISGRVSGSTAPGGRLSVSADALYPGGWQGLDTIEVDLLVNGAVQDRLLFDSGDNILTINTQDLVVGTGAKASGTYLNMSGADVVVTTGGAHMVLKLDATVIKVIPASARYRMTAVDDFGTSVSIARSLAQPRSSGGFSWGEVAAFIAVALFVGGFLGSVFGSKRRAPARTSVYATVQRRIAEDRARDRETTR